MEYVKIAFTNGAERTFAFDIQTSYDGYNFSTVLSGAVSSLSNSLQTFDFADVAPVRYVRIVGHGNSLNALNSFAEVEIYGSDSSGSGSEGTVVEVSTSTQLAAELATATAGKTIVLANGTYSRTSPFAVQNKNGTANAPIVIKAKNRGQAIISGASGFRVENSSHVVLTD